MGLVLSFWIRTAALACAGAFVLLAGACSENSGDTLRPTPVEGQTTEAGDVVLELSAREYTFVPDRLQMRPDQVAELKLTNDGVEEHSLSVYEDDEFDTLVDGASLDAVSPGEENTLSVDPPAQVRELYFRCEIHQDMTGEIEVGPDTAG
jgi:plastocyanin